VNAFLQTLRNLGPMRLVAIAIVTVSLLGFFGFLTTRITASPLALLYTELDQQDSSAIVQKLEASKFPTKLIQAAVLFACRPIRLANTHDDGGARFAQGWFRRVRDF